MLAASLVRSFCSSSYRLIAVLFEQVVPQRFEEVRTIIDALSCHPVLVDAADFAVIRRPRLWFTQVDWSKVSCRTSYEGPHLRVHVPTASHGAPTGLTLLRAQQTTCRCTIRVEVAAHYDYPSPDGVG
eukprot:122308-Amphidinium_carterae.1